MKNIALFMLLAFSVGCGSKGTVKEVANVPAEKKISGPIAMQANIPFAAGAVADNVKNECTDLGAKLASFTKESGAEIGVAVTQQAKVDTKSKGGVLVLEMINVHSGGNAMIGHNKSVTVKAQLFKDGTLVDTTELKRSSGGGIGAGFKGSCSVLGRTVKTLGTDVAKWMKNYSI